MPVFGKRTRFGPLGRMVESRLRRRAIDSPRPSSPSGFPRWAEGRTGAQTPRTGEQDHDGPHARDGWRWRRKRIANQRYPCGDDLDDRPDHSASSARPSTVSILDIVHALAYVWEAAGLFEKDEDRRRAFTRERLLRILRGENQGVIK